MYARLIPCATVVAAVVLISGLAGGPSQASASDRSGGVSGIGGVAPGALLLLGCAGLVAAPRKREAQDEAAPAGVPSNA